MPRYIVYACPVGSLAEQLDRYFARSLAEVGPNAAHAYMPHVTLTGFFADAPESVPGYIVALEEACAAAMPTRPAKALTVTGMELGERFHGLLLESDWIKALAADFAARAESPTRNEVLRLKDWLHLSLAYEFPPAHGPQLAQLANELVDPFAPAAWELRFYERHSEGTWVCHASWEL
jgi:ubiquitin-associated SH3 domain-containing protein